ncbi:hypothetical protein EDC96DRAFT_547216 [Choanephora cucurbitarum]|nr:hypothetical protein EDC96DRAFT_547216 [Choanephora cucurbitarum]
MENTHIKTEESPSVTSNSETATVAATSTDNTVTSSSPTSTFQPFQQLHEAVLAAVNSNSATLPSSFLSAAVAAAQANGNVAIHPHPQQLESLEQVQSLEQGQQAQQNHQHIISADIDYAKKESIRASNRERKKKWRIHNEERNKDNDLRCRVNKRAVKLYGPGDSPTKAKWIQEEFEKRRQKRMDKERRKHIVNNVLSVPGAAANSTTDTDANSRTSNDNNNTSSTDNVQIPGIVGTNQIPNYYTPLPQIDTATAAKLLDFPTDLQRQLLEQLNNSMLALTNGMQQAATQPDHTDNTNNNASSHTTSIYEGHTNTSVQDNETQLNAASQFSAADNSAANEALQQVIAQGLSTTNTASVANSSGHNSPLQYSTSTDMVEHDDNNSSTIAAMDTTVSVNSDASPPSTEEEQGEKAKETEGEGKEGKKPEYPMDAVLTLMQLNAGWRQ